MPLELDPRFTFETFVVGPSNRLAVAAARRVSDTPGTTYNPLFIYSSSGLGKTHLMTAVGHQTERLQEAAVVLETLEGLMDDVSAALEAGEDDALGDRLREAEILLLDDIQFVAGHLEMQEELIRTWDTLASRGAQVILTSDRPPQEIDGLDERLLTRLSGGLIVDISRPDYETRVAIVRRKAEERGRELAPEVCQAVGRIAFSNVRELEGALTRVLAVQDLEDRVVEPDEVMELLGAAADRGEDELGELRSEISGTVDAVVEEAERRLADAILEWEGEGFRTRRLEAALKGTLPGWQAGHLVRRFEQDVFRLRQIEAAIQELEPDAGELEDPALRDPDRLAEAEALLAGVRERRTPPPGPPEGPGLDAIVEDNLVVRAARAVAAAPGEAYNPLYVMGPEGSGKSTLLMALGNTLRERTDLTVAYLGGGAFAEGLINALEHSRLEAWRARFRRADVLLLDDLGTFAEMERAQEELFYLFEALYRDGRQLVFAARTAPQGLDVPGRLRSRLEGGLVVELDAPLTLRAPDEEAKEEEATEEATEEEATEEAEPVSALADAGGGNGGDPAAQHWILSREKVLWEWPYPRDWIEEELG